MDGKRIIISRTDSIGDVMLTLPLLGYLKMKYPEVYIIFLGKNYTQSVVSNCEYVDCFASFDDMEKLDREQQAVFLKKFNADAIVHVFPRKEVAFSARAAQIPLRIGTSHRFFHWLTCNKTVPFSRKNSDLHEAQLNFKLLEGFNISVEPSIDELKNWYGFKAKDILPPEIQKKIIRKNHNVILHPKSQGSAVEWGLDNFTELSKLLISKGIQVVVTGTAKEKEMIVAESNLLQVEGIVDLTGQLQLEELISLIDYCDALVAASTGPLHIAAALGKKAVGLYSARKPIHPGRWSTLGKQAIVLCKNEKSSSDAELDLLIKSITPEEVMKVLI